jgi:hypothetical protein
LAGPQGPQGTGTGGAGPQGPQGPQGPAGVTGPQGPTGPATQGPQGPAGPIGVRGPQGPQGAGGPQGGVGPNGFQGSPGDTGPQGPQGPTGPQGPAGPQGTTGNTGASVSSLGVNTPAGPTGYILATDNISANYSDRRLKENIKKIDNCIEKIQSITGVYFTQNKLAEKFGYHNYDRQVGFIAQQVKAVLPESVSIAPFDADKNGNSLTGDEYLTINYTMLIPLVIEAIKEQQKEIKKLLEKIS